MNKRELLSAFLKGEISLNELKTEVNAPSIITALVFEPSGPNGEVLPDDIATVSIDGKTTEMAWKKYQELRAQFPDSSSPPPAVFVP